MNKPEKPTPPESWDRDEWERKSQEYSDYKSSLVEQTREHAIANVTILDLDQPLLRFLTDEELTTTVKLSVELQGSLRDRGLDAAQTYVAATLRAALENERIRRLEAERDLRIQLEANGHEVWLGYDEVAHRQTGRGWCVLCHCELETDYRATRDEAYNEAEQHRVEHGGEWDHDISD